MTHSSNSIQVISPSTQELLFEVPTLTQDQVDHAVQKSVLAFAEWKKVPVSKRVSIMEKFCQLFEEKKDKVAASITSQMGRPIRYGHGEVKGVLERANYMISVAEESLKDDVVEHVPGVVKRYQRKEPLGPVFLIAAWNYPYLTTVNNIIPALLAGNTVLLKQSPQTPQCADIFVETLREAGVPTDAIQAVHVQDKEANYLVQHPSIQFVNFTGSVAVGKKIRQAIGDSQHLIGLYACLRSYDMPLTHQAQDRAWSWAAKTLPTCCLTAISAMPWRTLSMAPSSTLASVAVPSNDAMCTKASMTSLSKRQLPLPRFDSQKHAFDAIDC